MGSSVKLTVFQNADMAANHVCDMFVDLLNSRPSAVLGLATGGTPQLLYKALVKAFREGRVDFKQARSFNLDEYVGLHPNHAQSYRAFMDDALFRHIDIATERTHFPDVAVEDLEQTGIAYDALIDEAGGVDLQLLGIGRNGHIGFNEPGTSFSAASGPRRLADTTRADNQRFFGVGESVPLLAVSMGVRQILKSKRIVLMAIGARKAEAMARLFADQDKSEQFPATALIDHPDIEVVCDAEAAVFLKARNPEQVNG